MVNIVTIDGQRYLVDVGFGGDNASRPMAMTPGVEVAGIGPQRLRLEYKTLAQRSDRSQKVWVYAHRAGDDAPWIEGYCFTETEFFAADFEVMNWSTMTAPQGFFVQNVVCVLVLLGEGGKPAAQLSLFNGRVSRRENGEATVVQELKSEEQRVEALGKWFRIQLEPEQRNGIIGLSSELRGE